LDESKPKDRATEREETTRRAEEAEPHPGIVVAQLDDVTTGRDRHGLEQEVRP
jgi:hypothetical protein